MNKNTKLKGSGLHHRAWQLTTWIGVCLITLAGCGKAPAKPAPAPDDLATAGDAHSSDDSLLPDGIPSSDIMPPADDVLSPGDTLLQRNSLSTDNSLSTEDSPFSGDSPSPDDLLSPDDPLSPEDLPSPDDSLSSEDSLAHAAYSALLSGDNSLLDEESLRMWHLEDWSDFLQSGFSYEYTYLDLDEDGVAELLIQMEDAPLIYNAVFHYADGRLFCWNSDTVEMTGGAYPLQNGTMVSEYHFNDTCSYTIFRYLPNGEYETLSNLYIRESLIDEDRDEPCPYYEIDGQEVDQTVFERRLEELILNQMLPRSAWTTL